jgi:hypothetical protein
MLINDRGPVVALGTTEIPVDASVGPDAFNILRHREWCSGAVGCIRIIILGNYGGILVGNSSYVPGNIVQQLICADVARVNGIYSHESAFTLTVNLNYRYSVFAPI